VGRLKSDSEPVGVQAPTTVDSSRPGELGGANLPDGYPNGVSVAHRGTLPRAAMASGGAD